MINFVDMIGSNKLQDVDVLANITNKTIIVIIESNCRE